ncbi:MAG: hypothetical protein HY549_08920 [Elusimicrobia bacterium]|nr:hypothetical protein [Elusimicrobiota bacterium]
MVGPADCPLRAAMPRFSLPVRHFALAAAAFWAFAFFLFLSHRNLMGFSLDARWVLGCVHLLTLGWLSATILGAMSQMLPVHAGTPLRWPWAPMLGFWVLALGLAVFVGELWSGKERYWLGTAMAGMGMALYLISYAKTLSQARELPFTERHFAAALAFLAALASLGLMLALDRQTGALLPHPEYALIAHVHLALIGWVTLSILGASYRLFYPAAISRASGRRASQTAFFLLALGAAALAVDALCMGLKLARLWSLILAFGYLAYLWQLRHSASKEWRLKDVPTAFSFLGIAGGIVWMGLGLALSFGIIEDRWEARAAYGVCALLGWATPWVIGQSCKIFPFMVWRSAYGEREDAPDYTGAQPKLAWSAFAFLALGWPLAAAGLLAENQAVLTTGLAFVLGCATVYALQSGLWLSHIIKPRTSGS